MKHIEFHHNFLASIEDLLAVNLNILSNVWRNVGGSVGRNVGSNVTNNLQSNIVNNVFLHSFTDQQLSDAYSMVSNL